MWCLAFDMYIDSQLLYLLTIKIDHYDYCNWMDTSHIHRKSVVGFRGFGMSQIINSDESKRGKS